MKFFRDANVELVSTRPSKSRALKREMHFVLDPGNDLQTILEEKSQLLLDMNSVDQSFAQSEPQCLQTSPSLKNDPRNLLIESRGLKRRDFGERLAFYLFDAIRAVAGGGAGIFRFIGTGSLLLSPSVRLVGCAAKGCLDAQVALCKMEPAPPLIN